VNAQLIEENLNELLIEYKDIFAWTYKDLKNILLKLAQHHIKLDTLIPPTHHARYKMNPNYEQLLSKTNKILIVRFLQHVKEII